MVDNKTEFSVLVDRSVGGSSVADGQIELMLHRYAFINQLILSAICRCGTAI